MVPELGLESMSSPSSPPKIGDSGKAVVAVERVVSNSGAVELPLLTKANYHEWALVMQVSLEAMELWDAVVAVSKERAKDRRALAAILRAVPPEMKAGLAVKKTAKEAWDAVKSMRVGDDRVKAASVQRLWKEYENVVFRDGESVGDFTMRISGLVGSLREMGETLEDGRVVKKILRVVPKKMKQVAVAIEMLADINAMSVEELVGRLQVAEEADAEEPAADHAGRLFLTEEQWEARRRQRDGKERACNSYARHGSGEKGVGRSGSHDKDDGDASSTSSGARRRYRGRCFNCGVRGHRTRDCRETKERALLADADEPALL